MIEPAFASLCDLAVSDLMSDARGGGYPGCCGLAALAVGPGNAGAQSCSDAALAGTNRAGAVGPLGHRVGCQNSAMAAELVFRRLARSVDEAGPRSLVTSAGIVPAQRQDEPPGCGQVTARGEQHADDLALLVDGPVQIRPPAGDLDMGLIGEPQVARSIPTQPRRLDELRCEPLDPPVDGDVVDGNAALGQQFFDVAVGPVAQVPADGRRDHLPREPEVGEP